MINTERTRLLTILSAMPDEAFTWLLLAIHKRTPGQPMPGCQIWPDGIGGFSSESRASIVAAQDEAKLLLDKRP